MEKLLSFITNYQAVLKRAFKVAKQHYSKHNQEITDDALTRPEFRIFLCYVNFYYNLYKIYKSTKGAKQDIFIKEKDLNIYKRYL